jgi:hypothetical protein
MSPTPPRFAGGPGVDRGWRSTSSGAGEAPITGRRLDVLLADGPHHVAGRQSVLGHLLRVQPDAHRIVARAEQPDLPDPLDAGQAVLDVEQRIVAQVRHVVAVVGRKQVHDHGEVGRALDRGDAEGAHLLGQPRLGLRDPVLHQLLGLVGVGAQPEGDGQRHGAVGGRLAAHVEHVLDPVDRLLDGGGDGLGDHLGIGARILGADHDGGRHHLRIFRDRQGAQRQQAGDEDERRQHAREDGAVDEESG